MRFLGIDFGAKRVGLALSDEEGRLAFPYTVLKNDKDLLTEVERIVKEQKVRLIVMGESKDFKGKDNPIAGAAQKFAEALAKATHKRVEYEPEFLTSVQAARGQPRRPKESRGSGLRSEHRRVHEMLDASAAAIILQSYLDRTRH